MTDEPNTVRHVRVDQLIDREIRSKANHSGLTSIDARVSGGVAEDAHIHISRASSGGSHRRLSADDARRMADEIETLDGMNSVLLEYFTAGRDDPEELIEALENAAHALEIAESLDQETLRDLRYTIHNAGDD